MHSVTSRRAFLKDAIALTAASALGSRILPVRGADASAALTSYRLGCFTRPFDQHDYRTALDAIAESGYKGCGFMTAKGKNWVIVNEDTTPEEAAAAGAAARERGLEVLSVYVEWKTIEPISKAVETLRRLIDHGAACGSQSLMLGGTGDERLFAAYYKAIAESCPYAAEKGVGLTIKPHGGLNATGPQCRKIIESVGQPNFRLWYDPGNIYYYSDGKEDPATDANTVDGLVVGISAKDFLPPKDVMVTPGNGRVDFAKVLARLRQGGFRSGPVLVETLGPGDLKQVIAEARKARAFFEELLAQLRVQAGARGLQPPPRA